MINQIKQNPISVIVLKQKHIQFLVFKYILIFSIRSIISTARTMNRIKTYLKKNNEL